MYSLYGNFVHGAGLYGYGPLYSLKVNLTKGIGLGLGVGLL